MNNIEEPQQPELTRDEMDQWAQGHVDALKAAGQMPSFEQVLQDVREIIAQNHPGDLRDLSEKSGPPAESELAESEPPVTTGSKHGLSPGELAWRRRTGFTVGGIDPKTIKGLRQNKKPPVRLSNARRPAP